MKRPALTLTAVLLGSHALAGQAQTFRAGTDAVLVDVSVTAGNQPVKDLARDDFSLTDNGVVQQIDEMGMATLPIDVSLLVDTGSEARYLKLLPGIQKGAAVVRSLLKAGDRGSLVTVDSQMRWGAAPEDSSSRGERGTAILDAIVAAVMTRVDPGRRHLVVAVTAGMDTHSLISAEIRAEILAKSEAAVYVIAGPPILLGEGHVAGANGRAATERKPATPDGVPGAEWLQGDAVVVGDYSGPLRAIADATGGRVFDLSQPDSFQDSLKRAIDEYRTSYVLRYRPRDVPTKGWHALSVKMTRPGSFSVKARRGYWGD